MIADTPLDTAHGLMAADDDDDAARLGFFARLAESELFLLLEAEAEGEIISPQIFPVEGHSLVLAFDREERLAEFVGGAASFAAMSGRKLAGMLAAQSLGMGINLGVAPSSILIPPEAVQWLVETLGNVPREVDAMPEEFSPPTGLPQRVVTALDAKLAQAAGLAEFAYLAAVRYRGGAAGHMLAFIGAVPGSEGALAQAAGEALMFSGIDAGEMDVAFLRGSDPAAAKLARVGLRFDLPQLPAATQGRAAAPGSDPDKPPKLR